MQFFKVLEKWFSMAKYLPIIVLWYSERGFYKITIWSPVLGVFTDALNHLAVYMPITGWVDVEKSIKVANITQNFGSVTLTKKYDLVLGSKCTI